MRTLLQDLRYAVRQTVKSPGFALAAIVSLALGVGATTAVFSVIYGALIHPYPYKAVDRIFGLTVMSKTGDEARVLLNGPEIRFLRRSSVVEDLVAMDSWSLTLTGGDFPEDVETLFVTSNAFDFLGEPPVLGRGLIPSDAVDGQEPQPVAVLSYKFWQRHFNANPDAVGKTLQLNRKSYRIVGVAAKRFRWENKDVYLPLDLTQDPKLAYRLVLRLKPGESRRAASAGLQPLMEEFARDMPNRFPERFQVTLHGLNDWVIERTRHTLVLLLIGVALLLAIGCGNVSILLLARGTVREHELAVRTAIGAGRGRIVRQLLTESLLLAMTGAVMGIMVAFGAVAAMKVLLPQHNMFASEFSVRINLPVLLFSIGLALATVILFGLSPALQLSRSEPGKLLQSGVRKIAGSKRARRTHSALISVQIALTLLLLACSGATVDGFVRLLHLPLGYDPHNVISIWIPLQENSYRGWSERAAYFEQLRATIGAVPGVRMTAIATNATPPNAGSEMRFEVLGQPELGQRTALLNLVGPEFFDTLRIPLLHGRIWSETENHNGALLAVINAAMARVYFPNGDPVGHSLKLPDIENSPGDFASAPGIAGSWLQVVGVVGDSRDAGLRGPVRPAIFVPWTLQMPSSTQILVRSEAPPLGLLNAIRRALATVNPDQQAARVVSDLDKWISDQPEWQQEHLVAWLFSAFAVLALSLAAVGLYSVVSYTVTQRTNEFGIRVALGAQRRHVLQIVVTSMVMSVGSGMLAGVVLTLTLNPLLAQWVGGNLRDLMLLPVGALLLCLVAAIACLLPALRAAYVDPMTAVRCD
jgi:predicted permease